MSDDPVHAVVPAAGIGRRMGGETPKQYLEIDGRSVLEHTLWRLAGHPRISRVVVAVAPDDRRFQAMRGRLPPGLVAVDGGAERCHSVLAGLEALAVDAPPDVWVMVHDAARPCLRYADVDRMIEDLRGQDVGGILATPVRDTLKRCDSGRAITGTVDRSGLWHAMTPQMFRLGRLLDALRSALADGVVVTDEAQAMERSGCVPLVVPGHGDNIKITHPDDLALARLIMRAQGAGEDGRQQ